MFFHENAEWGFRFATSDRTSEPVKPLTEKFSRSRGEGVRPYPTEQDLKKSVPVTVSTRVGCVLGPDAELLALRLAGHRLCFLLRLRLLGFARLVDRLRKFRHAYFREHPLLPGR